MLSLLLGAHAGLPVSSAAPAVRSRVAPAADALAAVVPQLRGMRDLGRAPAALPVDLALTLPYRHDAELHQLLELQGNPSSRYYEQFLSNAQFANYFAPSPEDEARVARTLQAAGFRIVNRYPNRTVIDVQAPAAVAERYFQTEIHRVSQPGNGERYANVRPATMPAELRGSVAYVTGLSNVIHYSYQQRFAGSPQHKEHARLRDLAMGYSAPGPLTGTRIPGIKLPPLVRDSAEVRATATAEPTAAPVTNGSVDPGFESGKFGSWLPCFGISSKDPEITSSKAHSGSYAGYARSEDEGTSKSSYPAGLCEGVTIPASGVLTFWVYQTSTETSTTNAFQEADLIDDVGDRIYNMYQTVSNAKGWVEKSYNLSKYAGGRYYLYFGVDVAANDAKLTEQYVDDVTLSGTSYPVVSTKIGGPMFGPDDGYGPAVTATAYDMPVQHGYDGSGRATAVEISGDYSDSDLIGYLGEFGITRGGTTTREEIDGGATVGTQLPSGSSEATLDVETIVSLAPSTHLYMYLFPDLSDTHIEDAYNRTVSDNLVEVANSSFDGCETGDSAATHAFESIVAQGASKGITFAASAGDDGSAFCDGKTGVGSPASDPEVVGVGGTSLYVNDDDTYKSEDAWKGSGGGVSVLFPVPSYQSGLAGVVTTGRNVPDVSFAADPNTGTSYFFAGSWQGPTGGTSWAAPIFTAEQTGVNDRNRKRAGYVNSRIYAAYKTYGLHAFHDVTSGSNGAFTAHAGYDDVTGLGTLDGNLFIPEE